MASALSIARLLRGLVAGLLLGASALLSPSPAAAFTGLESSADSEPRRLRKHLQGGRRA